MTDEILVLTPVLRPVHHPYTDLPGEGIHVLSYAFEEVFAEKMRALAERQRPRDLYDVVHLYRRQDLQPDRAIVRTTLARNCEFKRISVPTYAALTNRPERASIEVEWEQMLGHQLPTCPPFHEFWQELPGVFDWLNEQAVAPTLAAIPMGRMPMEADWRPPAMARAWGAHASSMETIRFAAASRLCVELDYTNESGEHTAPTIEPYSVRRTSAGDLLLFGVKADTGESRSYRLDRIQSATVTQRAFQPRFEIELTASGPLETPTMERARTADGSGRATRAPKKASSSTASRRRAPKPLKGLGLSYTFACMVCGKTFKRSTYDAKLNPHKNRQGWHCLGRIGYLK